MTEFVFRAESYLKTLDAAVSQKKSKTRSTPQA